MDDLTRERYGPITEADLWHELHPDTPAPRPLIDAARARQRREALRRERDFDRLMEAA